MYRYLPSPAHLLTVLAGQSQPLPATSPRCSPPKSRILAYSRQNNNLSCPPITKSCPSEQSRTSLHTPHFTPQLHVRNVVAPYLHLLSPSSISTSFIVFVAFNSCPPSVWKCRIIPVANRCHCHPWESICRAPHELTALPSRKPRCLLTIPNPLQPKKSNDRIRPTRLHQS